MLWVLIREAILMSTHNMRFYGTHKNCLVYRLDEAILMSTHNMRFYGTHKNISFIALMRRF